ncbi:MAG TPA: PAS domain S-box protein [Ohtaekwangia sp.]|nr:PAS domain S-box protein [Ohtaekwangia sp.]
MKSKRKKILSNYLTDKQFKALIENAHEGIILYDKQGRVKYVSHSVEHIAGYRQHEILDKPGTFFLHPDDAEMAAESFLSLLNKPGKGLTLFQRIRHKKGHYIWSESRLTNFLHIDEINGIVSNFRDITEQKNAVEEVRKTNELLETVNRNLSEGIFMGILDSEFIYVNEAFLNMTGYRSFREIEKQKPTSIFGDKLQQREILKLLKAKQTLKQIETDLKRKNGETFKAVLNISLLKHEGKANYFVGTLRDISKEKQAEVQLIESRNFLDNIVNTVAAPIFVKDSNHRWVLFNDKFCELLGHSRKQILGKTDTDLIPKKEAEVFYKTDKQVLRTGKTITTDEILTRNGKPHHLLTVKSRYINEKGERFVIGFVTEITYLKKAEAEIKHLHENLEGVLESSDESIFSVDQNFCYTAFNHRHKNIMKMLYGADIKIGANKIQYIKHEDKKWVKTELVKALHGKHFVTEHYQEFPKYTGYIQVAYNPIHDENKKVKGVAVFVQDITHRKKYEQIINSINANLRGVMESTSDGILAIDRDFRIILFNNSYAKGIEDVYGVTISVGDNFLEVLPSEVSSRVKQNGMKAFRGKRLTVENQHPGNLFLETSFNPIYDDRGKVIGAAMFIRNITERNRMELSVKALNEELTEQNKQLAAQELELKSTLEQLSERNFELDQLMYKTSHDLRSPLSSIMGLINLANLDRDPEALQQYLLKIEGRVKKLDEFIRSMLDYARVNRVDIVHEEIDLQVLAKSCITELEYLDNFHQLKTEIHTSVPKVICKSDKLRLKIIFSNIISNAYKYLNQEVDSYLKIEIVCTKDHTRLIFEDNGIGIKTEYVDKIFNMFYRATDRSQGSGLGMYIVKQAVERLNGTIKLKSEYGKGTTLDIMLPRIN